MSLASRRLASLISGPLLATALLAAVPTPALAAATTLCSGYGGCVAAGYSDAGYGAASGSSYWRMFSGRNCTNYVAFRMIRAGMSTERPFAGTGNAVNWGTQMASKTDSTPSVGSVAWFRPGVGGAGAVGHVAYVERVVSLSEIVVSESNFGSDFSWRRITQGTGWPSGFIHLADNPVANAAPVTDIAPVADTAPVTNTAPVTITGSPQVGQTLGSTPGTWPPAAALAYQWLADGVPVVSATGPRLQLSSDMGGKSIVLRVTGSASGYATTTADSAAVLVGLGTLVPSTVPLVDGAGGRVMVGDLLTASQPAWSPAPRTTKVQWLADGTPISGANDWSLQLTADQVGRTVAPVVTAKRPGYAATPVPGAAVGPVLGGVVQITTDFAVTGRVQVGKKLRVTAGAVTPVDATTTYRWLRNGSPISGASGPTYVPRGNDAGKSIAVSISVEKAGWAGRTRRVSTGTKVAARPVLALKTASSRGRGTVWFRVSAPGTSRPNGTAVVTIGRASRTVKVVEGVGRLRLSGLLAGVRVVKVAWKGAEGVLAGSTSGKLRVAG